MSSYFKTSVFTIFFAACLMMSVGNVFAAKKASRGKGYWVFRTRVINVVPNDDSGKIADAHSGKSLPAGAGVESDRTLEVDFTYMLNPSFGFELILGTTRHDIVGTGILDGVNVGNVGALPPTLTAQYHFMPNSKIRPYVGVGLNYTLFYAEYARKDLETVLGNSEDDPKLPGLDVDGDGKSAPVSTSISLTNSLGLAKQFGVDIMIGKNVFINIDVKHIQMKTTATIKTAYTEHTVDVDINPWVIGVGAGMSF